jgi:cytochrome b561
MILKRPSRTGNVAYVPLSKWTTRLHWLVAIGIVFMLIFGLKLWLLPSGPEKAALIPVHKSLGIVVGFLATVRIGLRIRKGFPRPVSQMIPVYETFAARFVQVVLLVATLALPLSGIAKSLSYARSVSVFGFQIIPQLLAEKNEAWHSAASSIHTWSALVLSLCLAVHVGAALWHHLAKRDATLLRMIHR